MLKNPFQVAVTFTLVALVVKLVMFGLDVQHGAMEDFLRYIYMLILLIAVFFGIRSNKIASETPTTFGQDFRAGARTASFFAILTAVITYVYYAKIDSGFFAIKQQPLLDEIFKEAQERIKTEDRAVLEDSITNQIYGIKMYLSPYFQAMWTMFGLVFLGIFNAAVFAFLMKKYPGFKK